MEWLDKPLITVALGSAVVTVAMGTVLFWLFPALGWAAVEFGVGSVRGAGSISPAAVFTRSAIFGSLVWAGQLLHELGHFLAFRFHGQSVSEFHLGARNWTVATTPPQRSRAISCLVAGPALHVLYGCVLGLIGAGAGYNVLLLAAGGTVIFSALAELVPFVPGSDGAMIRELHRDDR